VIESEVIMLRTAPFALLFAALGLLLAAGSASPMPTSTFAGTDAIGEALLWEANGCHSSTQNHYDNRLGETVRHFHRKDNNCRPVRVGGGSRSLKSGHCHRDVEKHRIWEGGPRVWHYHKGNNCRPVEVSRNRSGHCHRDVRDHSHEGWGWTVHRHEGSNCRVQPYREEYRDRGHAGCIELGFLYFCP